MAGGELLVIAFFFGLAGGVVGRIKGSSFYAAGSDLGLVQLPGLLAAVFYRFESQEFRRQGPLCGHVIILHDALCVGCGEELEFPGVALEPATTARGRSA